MKGPSERLKYDGRRLWECPSCGHRERWNGATTSVICNCQANEPSVQRRPMRLIEEGFRQFIPKLPLPRPMVDRVADDSDLPPAPETSP